MPRLPASDRNPFFDLSKGYHDFTEDELVQLHEMADAVNRMLWSANQRQARQLNSLFKQVGSSA